MTGGWLHLDFAVMDYYVFLNPRAISVLKPTCVFMDICAVMYGGIVLFNCLIYEVHYGYYNKLGAAEQSCSTAL